jgi:predicted 3-demethylubiquinone-9 3-methyltransferase (glyoxalase superfamily)
MPKITPFLWFDDQAQEAANFYSQLFPNSKINRVTHYLADMPRPAGSVMSVEFTLDGQEFTALNGGKVFELTPAISFVVPCQTQEEVDHFWDKLSDGGATMPCGWLTDKFGVTWQIVPVALLEMLQDEDTTKAQNVTQAMMQMEKLDIQELEAAYAR